MKYTDYNIRITIKSIIMFEKLAGVSFMSITENNMLEFIYCVFITSNNNVNLTYNGFLYLMEDKKFASWISKKVEDLLSYIRQFNSKLEKEETVKSDPVMISQVVSYMAANGIDINYIMNEMQLWELDTILSGIQNRKQDELEIQRMWTYITISPMIDSKKVKNPQSLIKFPWEKERDNAKAQEDLDKKAEKIKAFFAAQEKARQERENGNS